MRVGGERQARGEETAVSRGGIVQPGMAKGGAELCLLQCVSARQRSMSGVAAWSLHGTA